jgi:hypothetical protein
MRWVEVTPATSGSPNAGRRFVKERSAVSWQAMIWITTAIREGGLEPTR